MKSTSATSFWSSIIAMGVLAGVVLVLLVSMIRATPQIAQAVANPVSNTVMQAGPDLTLEISLNPAAPGVGEMTTLTVIYRNIGTSASGPATLHAYKDPVDQPPTGSTTPNLNLGLAQIPALSAGGSGSVQKTGITFDSMGCNHVIYVWIDRGNTVAEGDENNNLIALPVCVGVSCTADSYEQDSLCTEANWITENAAQAHSFCHPTDNTQEDIDWLKFTAFAGVTYTLGTSNAGIHANPRLAIYNSCGGAAQAGLAGSVSWQAPTSGLYYAKVDRSPAVSGPMTAYSLTLQSQTGVTDNFEVDNASALAHDIASNGTRQAHLFQAPNDEDWVKFAVKAGESFILIADNPGTGVTPVVTLYSACNQVPSQNSLGQGVQQVQSSATTDQIYYARVANQNPAVFGANAHYDIRVIASACVADDLEADNAFGQAKSLTVGGASQTHNFCPASDEDWAKFTVEADKIYVVQTSDLAFAADTDLQIYGADGTTVIAQNDDFGYVSASRIVWKPTTAGVYYARVRHVNAVASGPNTQYALSIQEGFCQPDAQEGDAGDNGPGDAARTQTNGSIQLYNFCADPLDLGIGDQDWLSFPGAAGGNYQILTTGLGPNSDPVLELYAGDGDTRILSNDDAGDGQSASLHFTPTIPGTYFVRVRQYNSTINGNDATYKVQVFATEPPTPTPTPLPTPTPTATPTPAPTAPPSTAETLIVVNRARFETLYGGEKATALMNKLLQLADDSVVKGLVLQVENDPAVAAAYATWTTDATTLANNDTANAVIAAIRSRVLSFSENAPSLKQVVVVGDDRVVPFRRVLDRVEPTGQNANSIEDKYAPDVVDNGAVEQAALAAKMILTDDYLVDKVPSQWQDKQNNQYELFIPDYAVGRLIETPDEIMAFIDNFLGGDKTLNPAKVLVTGYDFVQDNADRIKTLYGNDTLTTDSELIAAQWQGAQLRTKYLQATPRFDVYSINGHSTHLAQGVPDKNNITAGEILAAGIDLSGVLVYSLGCHGGLNEPGALDLPQAYMSKLANYVGNTGFGWGGGGIVYSEALMRNYSLELLRDTSSRIGPALVTAKQKYYTSVQTFRAYDAKVLMQVTLYGLPMVQMSSGGTLADGDPFPSAEDSFTPPTSFGDVAEGKVGYKLPGSFGAFGEETGDQGVVFNLDNNTVFAAGEPLQPLYLPPSPAPTVGELRGVVMLGGVYSDVVGVDPVIALADNEYITNETEPSFSSASFYPSVPFTIRNHADIGNATDTVVMSLGQFRSNLDVTGAAVGNSGVNRIYDQMSFSAYYSNSPDRNAANIAFIDGILDPATGLGQIKVEASDASGIHQVMMAYDQGQGQWQSNALTLDAATQKYTGVISGTVNTRFFVQVVDKAGNVAVNDNKGRYYGLAAPLPLAPGRSISRRIYLPVIRR